jgi:hypothetical protein
MVGFQPLVAISEKKMGCPESTGACLETTEACLEKEAVIKSGQEEMKPKL